ERMWAAAGQRSNSGELGTVVEGTANWAHTLVKAPVVVWVIDAEILRPLGSAGGATYDKTAELTPPGSWLAACARAEISNNIEGIAKAAEAHNGRFPPALREALGIANARRRLQ